MAFMSEYEDLVPSSLNMGPTPVPRPSANTMNRGAFATQSNPYGPYMDDFMDSPMGQDMAPWLRKMLMGGERMLPQSPPAMDKNYEIAGAGQGLGGLLGQSLSGGMY
tara:strand:- start:3552 stop:3872 length:321 start_codon:yes stop_codon:yes gene_type:complete